MCRRHRRRHFLLLLRLVAQSLRECLVSSWSTTTSHMTLFWVVRAVLLMAIRSSNNFTISAARRELRASVCVGIEKSCSSWSFLSCCFKIFRFGCENSKTQLVVAMQKVFLSLQLFQALYPPRREQSRWRGTRMGGGSTIWSINAPLNYYDYDWMELR